MKFPRNARIFRGQLDVAPFAIVFLLLVLFMMLSSLVYTPGVRLQLPVANDLPGSDTPPVSVAVDKDGRLYFENQRIEETDLKMCLRRYATNSLEPLVVLVRADESVALKTVVHVELLLRDAGVSEARLATLPGPFANPANNQIQ
jgi:biopolymer transport protein ExbD